MSLPSTFTVDNLAIKSIIQVVNPEVTANHSFCFVHVITYTNVSTISHTHFIPSMSALARGKGTFYSEDVGEIVTLPFI